MTDMIRTTGTVGKIIYSNEVASEHDVDPSYFYIMLLTQKDGSSISVKGMSTTELEVGLEVVTLGHEVTYKGQQQIEATLISKVRAHTNLSAHGWLISDPVYKVGPEISAKVRAAFPDNLHEALNSSDMLQTVDGVGPMIAESLMEGWLMVDIPAEALEIFAQIELGMPMIMKIMKAVRVDRLSALIRENPWSLCRMVSGFSFKSADKIAAKFELSLESELRYRAGIEAVMKNEVQEKGNTQLPRSAIARRCENFGLNNKEMLTETLDLMLAEPLEESTIRYDEMSDRIAPTYLYQNERKIANYIRMLMEDMDIFSDRRGIYEELVDKAAEKIGIVLDPSQRSAAINALCSPLSVITGGPGTGKSTTMSVILETLRMEQIKGNILLTAPTGRAAERLGEVTKSEGATIHRMLGFAEGDFVHNRANRLDAKTIIADEFSMVDINLAESLFQAIESKTRIIIVGDDEQLPSVGPGQVLGDIIRSEVIPVARLNVIHRQAGNSGIVGAAYNVARGIMPEFNDIDVHMVKAFGPENIMSSARTLMTEFLPSFGVDNPDDILLVTPQRKGPLGADALNLFIKTFFNPEDDMDPFHSVELGGRWWSVGDRVMHLKNDTEKNVMNGTVGRVVDVKPGRGKVPTSFLVDYGKVIVPYNKTDVHALTHSWSTTVHKYQGSEAKGVIHIVDASHKFMLERNLVYTGLTRAKSQLVFLGQVSSLEEAIRNTRSQYRVTGLSHTLRKALKVEPFFVKRETAPDSMPDMAPSAGIAAKMRAPVRIAIAPSRAPGM